MSQVAVVEDKFFSDEEKIIAYVRAEKSINDAIARENYIRDEARNEGRVEGRDEAKREMIQNMLNDNLPIESIMKYSGLSEESINKIKSSL